MKTKLKIKLNIKSIIYYEFLTKKSFIKLDYNNNDDIMKLLYCIIICNNDITILYDEFIEISKNAPQLFKQIYTELNHYINFISQFYNDNNNNNNNNTDNNNNNIYYKDIVANLIVNVGINAHYVMNEMNINELYMYYNAYNNKIKEKLEEKRLFTFLSMLPHIDGKKINNPRMIYPFEWEIEKENKEFQKNEKEIKTNFSEIMEEGKKIIEKINNK